MRILLAVDGSECSDLAVKEVAHRPWPAGSEVKVISAVEPPVLPTPDTWALPQDYYERLEKAAKSQARTAVNKAGRRLRTAKKAKLRVSTEILRGHPKHVIPDEAEEWGADLIVVGSHGYRGLKRLWLGSVSHAVALNAICSVEIVRSREVTANENKH